MDLDTLKIKESGSTLTRNESCPSEPGSTHPGGHIEHHFPPPEERPGGDKAPDIPVPEIPPRHLLLKVVMTFSGNMPRLTAKEIGVVAEGDSIEEAFRHLIEATREQLASAEGARAELLGYAPHTWFRFVPPGQAERQRLGAYSWPEGEDVEDFIAAATEGRYEEEDEHKS